MNVNRSHFTAISDVLGEEVSRRSLLRRLAGGSLAAGAAGGLRLHPRAYAQTGTPASGAAAHTFQLGQFTLRVLDDGQFAVPPIFWAINAPPQEFAQVLADAGHDPDAIVARLNILLIDTGEHLVLIDTGYGVASPESGRLLAALQVEGIAPGDIDTVILTHLHGDHFAGAVDAAGQATFANARHVINRTEYEYWWAEPSLVELPMPAEFKEMFRQGAKSTLVALQDRLEQIEADTEVVPGVRAIAAPGHTPGHLAIEVSSGDETLLHIVDAVGDPEIHLQHPDWFFAPDNWPAQGILTRRQLFDRAAAENLLVQTYHFPFPGVGRVTADGDGWLWEPAS